MSQPDQTSSDRTAVLHLRLLETTDVHGNLMPYDYYANRHVTDYGLTRAATMIRDLRAQSTNCLLFDNGDFLQGTPLSDLAAKSDLTGTGVHPCIMAMNAMGYDAVCIGNHEFNFGLDWLRQVLSAARFPVTCANLWSLEGAAAGPLFPPYHVLTREMQDSAGNLHILRIGVLGLTPPQVTGWDRHHLHGLVQSLDIVKTAEARVRELQSCGTDLIFALAHTGIKDGACGEMLENAALQLGQVKGIDAIFAGHTHEVFPSGQFAGVTGVDPVAGTLHETPAVMAGSRASHVGVLDLELRQRSSGWQITGSRSEACPVDAEIPADAALTQRLAPAHARALELTSQPLGHSARPLHSYLSLVAPSEATRIVMQAKRWMLQQLVKGTADEALPILAAAAPFKTGGRAGPNYYTDVPPGPICLRHAADLYSFPNVLCALRLTGKQVRCWLERATIVFNQVDPGKPGQVLINTEVPGHHFDMIDGLEYEIDLSSPSRFDEAGTLVNPNAHRIHNLRFDGAPILEEQVFLLATNNYRAYGGGPFPIASETQFAHKGERLLRDIVANYIQDQTGLQDTSPQHIVPPPRPHWGFRPLPDTIVSVETGPALRSYPEELSALSLVDKGDTASGFARLELALG